MIAALFLKCKQTYTDFYRKNPNSWRRNSKTLKVENKRCRDASQTSILANGVQKAENKRNLQVIIIMAKQTIFTSPFIVLLLQQCKIQITIRHRPSWQKSKIFKPPTNSFGETSKMRKEGVWTKLCFYFSHFRHFLELLSTFFNV